MYTRQRLSRDAGGLNQLTFGAANNSELLHFNTTNCSLISEGPFENGSEINKKRKRTNIVQESIGNLGMDSTPLTLSVSDPNSWTTALNNLGMTSMGMSGQPLLSDFDSGVGLMPGIPAISPLMPGMDVFPPPVLPDVPVVKEIIHCKSCTLFPPNPNLPPPARRERPPGCKTVFVGGLPENATDEIILEIFEQCGELVAIRKSKKNFCHIRFTDELAIDKAVYLSGYRIRLGSSTDKKDTGRLHVDFAQARDDFYEWECKQRMLAREERHRRRIEEEKFHPPSPSPSPVVHYSDHECILLAEKLKDDSKFREAIQTLLAWIERGEVNRRTANHFYSMIQSANSHIRRLVNEKAAHEKAMEVAKESYMVSLSGILLQFEQIVAVYHSACKQKAWDNFSKAQRKNISIWCKQAEEIRNIHSQELMGVRREEEMEMSDDELENPAEAKETEESALQAQADALKEENDSLRWQLDAYRNEVELLKQEQGNVNRSDEDVTRDEQLKILKQALQGMQQHLLKLHTECKKKEAELAKLREEKLQSEKLLDSLNNQQETTDNDDKEGDPNKNQENETTVPIQCVSNQDEEERLPETSLRTISSPVKSEREALLIDLYK
ncbi:ecto-NOX disulfide-thiol exchanger 2 isoform X2 [Microcaecilia unicolor]|uniref:Ecto-NOX disulfide-thiol exchanger 2 isoform X2 n=1 Tax=Microcaecilia unicolor TaxID=1415580 RepID=A0A6P7YQK5_9AMPH|nr:ecto-NOX disulfide-thiol exchanger 2 isoform X2 [Microcaecilia unicolor]